MTKELQSFSSSIIEISSKDNVTKEITMLVHKIDITNGNGLDFKEEYVEKYKDTLINKPVVCKYYPLVEDLGHHEQVVDSEGVIIGLETIAIGTIKEVWIAELEVNGETVNALYAKADLWNYKYPEIISCIEELFNSSNADSSVEVEIHSYGENPTKEYRYATDYTYIGNCLLGSTITPADSDAGVISLSQKEIAMAVEKDLQNIKDEQKGDTDLSNKELFNKGFDTKFHIETSELSHEDIRQQIYNAINPVNAVTDERVYKYYIREVFETYFIIEDWSNSDKLYRVSYSISANTLTVDKNWQAVEMTYQVVGTNLNNEVNELNGQLKAVKEELASMSEVKTEAVEQLESQVVELQAKIDELNSTIVSQEEAKSALEGTVAELNSKVEELVPFKDQVEAAEKQTKITELNEKYSKLLSEEVLKSEGTQILINELKVTELNELVVNEIAKQQTNVEVASKDLNKDVIVTASKQEDLIQPNLLQKYGFQS